MVSAAVPAHVVAKCNFHLDAVGESYGQHLRAAVSIALRLAKASGACVLHALIPGLCTRVASNEVAKLHAELMRRSDACEQLRRARSAGETQLRNVEIESS
jgi:hypothetical protein